MSRCAGRTRPGRSAGACWRSATSPGRAGSWTGRVTRWRRSASGRTTASRPTSERGRRTSPAASAEQDEKRFRWLARLPDDVIRGNFRHLDGFTWIGFRYLTPHGQGVLTVEQAWLVLDAEAIYFGGFDADGDQDLMAARAVPSGFRGSSRGQVFCRSPRAMRRNSAAVRPNSFFSARLRCPWSRIPQ